MSRLFSVGILSATLIGSIGCSETSVDSSATATSPTIMVTTETFSGTVEVEGQSVHRFTVSTSGTQVNVNLTAAGPPSTIYMGLGVGTYSNETCTLLSNGSVLTQASATAQLAGTVNAGSYCVMVYDAGNQTAPVTYTVVVNHY